MGAALGVGVELAGEMEVGAEALAAGSVALVMGLGMAEQALEARLVAAAWGAGRRSKNCLPDWTCRTHQRRTDFLQAVSKQADSTFACLCQAAPCTVE